MLDSPLDMFLCLTAGMYYSVCSDLQGWLALQCIWQVYIQHRFAFYVQCTGKVSLFLDTVYKSNVQGR